MAGLTKEDIAKLTPRAMVALAARCAQRVFKFVKESDLEQKHKDAVANAIQVVVDRVGGRSLIGVGANAASDAAAAAADAATGIEVKFAALASAKAALAVANDVAAYAIAAYAAAVTAFSRTMVDDRIVSASDTNEAIDDAFANARLNVGTAEKAIDADYRYLLVLAADDQFKLEDLGPLWPDGAPWDEKTGFPRFEVDLLLGDVTDEELKTIASKVSVALNEIFDNEGAGGVELEVIELFDFEEVPA